MNVCIYSYEQPGIENSSVDESTHLVEAEQFSRSLAYLNGSIVSVESFNLKLLAVNEAEHELITVRCHYQYHISIIINKYIVICMRDIDQYSEYFFRC